MDREQTCAINSEPKEEINNKKIGGCKKKINKIKYLQKSLKLASVITRKITNLTETEDVLNNSL
jgi:hypothetical protein